MIRCAAGGKAFHWTKIYETWSLPESLTSIKRGWRSSPVVFHDVYLQTQPCMSLNRIDRKTRSIGRTRMVLVETHRTLTASTWEAHDYAFTTGDEGKREERLETGGVAIVEMRGRRARSQQ